MHPVQFELIELNDYGLQIAVAYENGTDLVDRLLQEEEIEYTVIWQSKYNGYAHYDHAPFCCKGFIANYFIDGSTSFLIRLKERVNTLLNNRRMLENCFKKECTNEYRINQEEL